MNLRCPVCKAENSFTPGAPAEAMCRRCRADLGLLVGLERQRQAALAASRACLAAGHRWGAYRRALEADHLRRDEESRRLVALTALLCGDHALAWRAYRQGQEERA